MSGTSRDGVDIAFVEITGRFPCNTIRPIHAETVEYPQTLRAVLMFAPSELDSEKLAALDFALGEFYGKCVLQAMKRAGLEPGDVDVIGSHGQTIVHRPGGAKFGKKTVRFTLQIGSGAVIAQTTGVPTVSDFRSADVAVGGEGAPLVPVYDYVVLRSKTRSRVVLNIGGIANLTALPRGARLADIWSFDTGPGNCVLDVAVRLLTKGSLQYDEGGILASVGGADPATVERLLGHPYFKREPPKSTGWEDFGVEYTKQVIVDMIGGGVPRAYLISTLTGFVCRSIIDAIERFVEPRMEVEEVIVTGGGARNPRIMIGLQASLAAGVVDGEAHGIPSDAKEAIAFAYLAYLHLKRVPANVISQNAGLKPAILGALHPAAPG
jgi:anhydro-N-acetylmuramic acid kinase